MKILLSLLLFMTIELHANPEICDENGEPFLQFAAHVSLPNCHKTEVLNTSLCTDCLNKFEKTYDKKLTDNKEILQNTFLEASIKEFKKTITNNIVEALKMSALPTTGVKFDKSIRACKMKTLEDFSSSCQSPAALKLLKSSQAFNNLGVEVTNELAMILSSNEAFSSNDTLLNRNANSCFVRERDVLQLANAAIEEEFSPELIASLQKLNPKDFDSIDDLLLSDEFSENYSGDISELLKSLKLHPLLNNHFKDSASVISFFKSVKSPGDITKLREQLYSKQNGEAFDKKLSDSCNNSFKAFKEAICSSQFEKGNIDLNLGSNYAKLFDTRFEDLKGEFAANEADLNKNVALLRLCPNKNKDKKMSFTHVSDLLNSNLDETFKLQSLKEFKASKYDLEIGATKAQLCDLQDCEGTLICNIKKKYKAMKSSENLDSKLAKSSNSEVNNLLRSMIGDTSKVDAKSKEILIAQGIIPKADGSFVAQPDIPERRPEYFAQAPSVQNVNPAAPAKIQPETTKNNVARSQEVFNSEYANAKSSQDTSEAIAPDFKDLMKDSDYDEIQKMQDEIRRRLTNLPKKKPSSKEEAKTISRESFKKHGRKITPEQENLFADRMMQNNETSSALGSEFHQEIPNTAANQASVSNSETQLSKWKKAQMNAALADMQGARRVAAKDIIDAKTDSANKPLTTVALSIAEDPRITLSDVFNDKISRNDSETQLLKVLVRNQKNFILQVKSVNFKVIFDEKKELRILLESGDKKEAERLRPQLEMFLQKLKSNTSLRY